MKRQKTNQLVTRNFLFSENLKRGYSLFSSLFIPSPQVINVDDEPRLALGHHAPDFLMIHTLVLLGRHSDKVRSVFLDIADIHCFSEAIIKKRKDVEKGYNCPWWSSRCLLKVKKIKTHFF